MHYASFKISRCIFVIIVGLAFYFSPARTSADFVTPTPVAKELKINATVAPHSADFQLEFSSSAKDTVGSDETITYTITYGSFLAYSTSLTLEAEWSLGTIPAKNLYSFDIVSYMSESASQGYNETVPTIDLAKKKITWKIENFPKNTKDKTVSFKMKTPSRYVTDDNVEFTVKARLSTSQISLPQKEVKLTYTPTSFIAKTLSEFAIIGLEIRELKSTSASLLIRTNQPSTTTIFYGTTLNLEKSITDATFSQQKVITLNNLKPNTTYYLKIKVKNEKGISIITPELFTLTTPSISFFAAIDQDNAIIGAFGTILKSKASMKNDSPILFPKKKSLDIFLPFTGSPPAQVFLKIINSQVLGINNLEPLPFLEKIRLLETEPGVFSGKITAPSTSGNYDLMIETQNLDGNYTLDRLTKLLIAEPLRILSSGQLPIENAHVSFELYNPRLRMFEYFPAETFGSKNPAYSESDGTVDTMLITGRYKVHAASLGYTPKEEVFDFSPLESQSYPTITLAKSPFSLKDNFLYYWEIFSDSFKFFNYNLDKLFSSNRFLQLSFLLGLLIFSILSLFLTAHHLKIKLEDLLVYLEKYWRMFIGNRIPSENLFTGFVESNTGLPVHGVSVVLMSTDDKKIFYKNITNFLGEFHLPIEKDKEYNLIIVKKGFETFKKRVSGREPEKNRHLFQLEKKITLPKPKVIEFLLVVAGAFLRLFSDALLFAVIIFHLFYIGKFGITRDLPMFLITLFNIVLYFELVWRDWKLKEKKELRL